MRTSSSSFQFLLDGEIFSKFTHDAHRHIYACALCIQLPPKFHASFITRSGNFSGVREIDSFIVTEINQDVAEGLRKIWEDNFPTGMRKIDLYLPAGGMDILQGTMERLKLSNLAFNSMFSVFEYDKETSLSLFSHEFRFLKGKTPHHSHALRYRHRTSGRVAVCIGKTAWFEDLVDFCRGAHTLVADCPSPNPDQPESESSLRPGEIASLARLAGAKRIIINNCRQGRKYILENFTKKPDEDMEVYLNH